MEDIRELFISHFGFEPESKELLGVSGSNRKYFRIRLPESAAQSGLPKSVIGVDGVDVVENHAFCYMARHFASKGINVPEVYAESPDGRFYLQQDLGSCILFDVAPEEKEALLLKTIACLPKIQFEGADGMDWSVCHPQKSFDERSINFDLNYFKYCFLKTSGVEFNEVALQDDFDRLCADISKISGDAFMYRDFQARNVVIVDGEPYFIDFQGGMRGPIYYDLVSFVYQAKACYPEALRERMIDEYLKALRPYAAVDEAEFRVNLRKFALMRTLQVLGAYGFRGKFERKQYFIDSIPFAMKNLEGLLPEFEGDYPYLCEVVRQVEKVEIPTSGIACPPRNDVLEVEITSFSYRKGIPEDRSGNGGGYVFDCRGLHNPGRYEEYRDCTGRDAGVIEFLESRGEVQPYLEKIYDILDPHVEKYMERGFSHLMASFGCTGGQHRSVYCAEHLAGHLAEKFAGAIEAGRLRIVVRHREQ